MLLPIQATHMQTSPLHHSMADFEGGDSAGESPGRTVPPSGICEHYVLARAGVSSFIWLTLRRQLVR
jgi:hypothetical protein